MLKPNNYDNTQSLGGFTPIELGGHVLVIKKIEEVKSKKSGRDMIKISLDTDRTDSQPGYYTERWKNDNRDNKRWGCIVNQLILDNEGNTSKGFKTFIEMVKNSNQGLTDDRIFGNFPLETNLKGKLIGGAFGREEYLNSYGESKFSIKCMNFRTVQDVVEGKVEVPKDKLLAPAADYNSGYDDVTPIDDGEMPF